MQPQTINALVQSGKVQVSATKMCYENFQDRITIMEVTLKELTEAKEGETLNKMQGVLLTAVWIGVAVASVLLIPPALASLAAYISFNAIWGPFLLPHVIVFLGLGFLGIMESVFPWFVYLMSLDSRDTNVPPEFKKINGWKELLPQPPCPFESPSFTISYILKVLTMPLWGYFIPMYIEFTRVSCVEEGVRLQLSRMDELQKEHQQALEGFQIDLEKVQTWKKKLDEVYQSLEEQHKAAMKQANGRTASRIQKNMIETRSAILDLEEYLRKGSQVISIESPVEASA